MSYHIIIPARFNSSRLLGKPLLDLDGQPLIQHAYQRATETQAKRIIIATDDKRIATVAESFGAEVCLTHSKHESGTERIAEVIEKMQFKDDEIVINLQGDEPDISAELITQTAACLEQSTADMSTLATPIDNTQDLFNSNVVKVVLNQDNHALYFSRAPIPWDRAHFIPPPQTVPEEYQWLRHIGLYGYRCGFLRQYIQWPISGLEQIENLEQLRVLYYGGKIKVAITSTAPTNGVDTIADLEAARSAFEKRKTAL